MVMFMHLPLVFGLTSALQSTDWLKRQQLWIKLCFNKVVLNLYMIGLFQDKYCKLLTEGGLHGGSSILQHGVMLGSSVSFSFSWNGIHIDIRNSEGCWDNYLVFFFITWIDLMFLSITSDFCTHEKFHVMI